MFSYGGPLNLRVVRDRRMVAKDTEGNHFHIVVEDLTGVTSNSGQDARVRLYGKRGIPQS